MFLLLNNINVMIFESKAIISADSLIAVLVVILLLMTLVNIIITRMDTVDSIEEASAARVLGENIAEVIQTANSNGQGYFTIFRMPASISDEYYQVHINSSGLYIFVNGKTCYSHMGLLRVTDSEYHRDLRVTMEPNRTYNISNTRDQLTNTWIVIREVR